LITFFDEEHSDAEDRYISIGSSEQKHILLVIHTDRGDSIHIISCRHATLREQETYERQTR
jgi:uncharacterized protein